MGIKAFSLFPSLVEKYYSNGVYPWISAIQRFLFGWIPFSIGDLFYAFVISWFVYYLIKMGNRIKNKQANRSYFRKSALKFVTIALGIYVSFNVLWGLNYNRYGIDYQLNIETSDYTDQDLLQVTRELGTRLNELRPLSITSRNKLKQKKYLFRGAVESYRNLSMENSIFTYSKPSVKPSIYSYLGNYLGFTGYYNPFTGEAQVNTTVPKFVRPFTTCHEIGHQLGYAKESEANFAAYLSGISSKDPSSLYSVYFEMFAYASRYLYYSDSFALKEITTQLSPDVKKDISELRAFFRKYNNPFETAIDRIYSQYLKANEQPSGKMSYNEVVGMLIAYYKKNGKI